MQRLALNAGRSRWLVAGVCAALFGLAACDAHDEAPVPQVAGNGQAMAEPGKPAVPGQPDPSVPSASSALPPGDALPSANEDAAPGVRSEVDSSMSQRESATAMPLPGQANDHSAPVNDAKQPDRSVKEEAPLR